MTNNLKISLYAQMSSIIAIALATAPGWAGSRPEAGMISACSPANPSRFQCIFPPLSANLEIQYVSAQCAGVPLAWVRVPTGFTLQEFQILTVCPNSVAEVSFQIPIANQVSVGQNGSGAGSEPNVASAGAPVKLYAKAGTQPQALIDFVPPSNVSNLRMQCTVSLSGEYQADK
jgi:hypothetical protein